MENYLAEIELLSVWLHLLDPPGPNCYTALDSVKMASQVMKTFPECAAQIENLAHTACLRLLPMPFLPSSFNA